jgi:hypothetical protein
MTPNKLRRVFLETSAVTYHQHGHTLTVGAVEQAIGEGVAEVSNFVRMEYVRGVVINLIDLYFLMKREVSVSDALITWSQKVRQERKLKVVLMTIARWLHGLDEADDVSTSMRRLGEFIVQLVRTFDAVYERRTVQGGSRYCRSCLPGIWRDSRHRDPLIAGIGRTATSSTTCSAELSAKTAREACHGDRILNPGGQPQPLPCLR